MDIGLQENCHVQIQDICYNYAHLVVASYIPLIRLMLKNEYLDLTAQSSGL